MTTADGVKVAGLYYRVPRPKAVILLFHQAESGKGEYATIAPRLVAAGYSALAIDQRSGGDLFGRDETAATLGRSADPRVTVALAFSPGECLGGGAPVAVAARRVNAPVFVTTACDGGETAAARTILAAAPATTSGDTSPPRASTYDVAHRRHPLQINNAVGLLTAALDGHGVALLAADLVPDAIGSGRLIPLLPDFDAPSRPMLLIFLADRRRTPKLSSFTDAAVEAFGPPGRWSAQEPGGARPDAVRPATCPTSRDHGRRRPRRSRRRGRAPRRTGPRTVGGANGRAA